VLNSFGVFAVASIPTSANRLRTSAMAMMRRRQALR
jgi:hypothetical protein